MAKKPTCHIIECNATATIRINTPDYEGELRPYGETCAAHGLEVFIKWLMDPEWSDSEEVRFTFI